jgi:hypothetical protein
MNHTIPIFIAATIGMSILTVSICSNSASARNTIESEYFGGMGYGSHGGDGGTGQWEAGPVVQEPVNTGNRGAGPVVQEPVNTGNHNLDKAINSLYDCLSNTHEDPPTVHKADACYYQTLGSNGGTQT